jgi:hypothetical protein
MPVLRVAQRGFAAIGIDRVGQIVNLRPIGNRPVNNSEVSDRPIANRPQVTNLPHKISM